MSLPPDPPDHRIELRLRCGLDRAWRLVSDTDTVNTAVGLPPYRYTDEAQADGFVLRRFTQRLRGLAVEGVEELSSWEHHRCFEIRRTYTRGPFEALVHRCEIEAEEGPRGGGAAGTRVRHLFWVVPRGLLGRIFAFGMARDVLPAIRRYIEEMDRREAERVAALERALADAAARPGAALSSELPALPDDALAELPPHRPTAEESATVERLLADAERVLQSPILRRIGDLLLRGHEQDLDRIRPLEMARRWGTERHATVDAFLAATRVGLLNLRWDVVCPHCRGDKQNLPSLQDVVPEAFCAACNVHFEVDMDRSLEAVFTPHPQVRRVEVARYCLGGPATTPHVYYQSPLPPGGEFRTTLELPAGRFRVRFSGAPVFRWITVDPNAEAPPAGAGGSAGPSTVTLRDDAVEGWDLHIPPGLPWPLVLENRSSRRALAVVEDVAWAGDSLVAGELSADQRFRDLFSGEMLASGVSLAIQSVTILFTDLVGSTAMYGELGDARAFKLVWTHFDVLKDIVKGQRGATVKTIGDAIMAAFTRHEDALEAAALLHERMRPYLEGKGHDYPVDLKIGLHEGPAIVVTLNEQLDYFGTTVNLAARVQSCSAARDIVVTRHVAEISDGCRLLRRMGWEAEDFEAPLKGFEEPVKLLRFRRAGAGRDGGGRVRDEAPSGLKQVGP